MGISTVFMSEDTELSVKITMPSKSDEQPRRSGGTTRVPERLIEAPVNPTKRRRRLPKLKKRENQPTLSALEQLPPEVLQEICILSNNHFFPGTSPALTSKLSCEYIYMHFCVDGFLRFRWTNHRPLNKKYQSWLFARRWMTWPMFQKYVNRAYHAYIEWRNTNILTKNSCGRPIQPPKLNPSDYLFRDYPYLTYIRCRIPPKLLHAPFTPENIAFLRFLITFRNMHFSTLGKKGYNYHWAWREALHLGHTEMVSLLLSERLHWVVRPGLEDLQTAIRKSPCPKPLLKLLITKMVRRQAFGVQDAYINTYMFNYPSLAKFVKDVVRKDGENRDWLLDWIARAQDWQEAAPLSPTTMRAKYLEMFDLDGGSEDQPIAVAQLAGSKRKRHGSDTLSLQP